MPRQGSGGREEELYRVAASLFNQQGYGSTHVRQICRALNIRESSLYHYVRSKEDLLYNICERGLLRGLEMMKPIVRLPLPPDRKLRRLIDTHLRIITGTTNEQSAMLKELRSLSPDNQRKIIKLRGEYQALFQEAVAECIQEGLLREVPVKIATLAILGMTNWMIHWYSPEGAMTTKKIGGIFGDLLLKEKSNGEPEARNQRKRARLPPPRTKASTDGSARRANRRGNGGKG